MINEQLRSYIDQARSLGATSDHIAQELRIAGWAEDAIAEALGDAPATFTPTSSPSGRSYGKLIAIALGVIGVLALGGGAFAYYQSHTPEKIALAMIERLSEATTAEFNLEAKIKVSATEEELSLAPAAIADELRKTQTISFGIEGALDGTDINVPKAVMNLYLNVGSKKVVGIETRLLERIFYARLTDFAEDLPEFSPYKNIWVRFDTQEYLEEESSDKPKELTTEQQQHIRDLFASSGIIENIEKLPDETVKGVTTYHYQFSLNKENFIHYIEEVEKIAAPDSSEESSKALRDGMKDVSFTNGHLFIGKKDKFLYRLSVDVVGKAPDGRNFTTTLSAAFWNYNQPVNVEKPQDSKTFEEFFSSANGQSAEFPEGRDAKRISHISQLRTAVELYYDDNGHYPLSLTDPKLSIYLIQMPTDPLTQMGYTYVANLKNNPTKYHVWAELETKAPALNADIDYNSQAWGGINGALESCTSPTTSDCIYDQGQL